jgi:hypothetical protein
MCVRGVRVGVGGVMSCGPGGVVWVAVGAVTPPFAVSGGARPVPHVAGPALSGR